MVNKDIENVPNKKVQALIQLFYFIFAAVGSVILSNSVYSHFHHQ
jgi:hypothetical protein